MKQYLILFSVLLFLQSCKNDKEQPEQVETTTTELSLTTAEKIAKAYGVDNWDAVNEIKFSFNVKKDSSLFSRNWTWSPKTNNVALSTTNNTIRYNRNTMDSTFINADKAFINDKFWLLAPYNLVWDKGVTTSETANVNAPISNKKLNKITISYPEEGGYTPGDAYDFYYNEKYMIEEWVYRKGNAQQPTMLSTWENTQDFNGIKIALSHKKTDDNWELFFSDVSVK
ncbi:hypothetical protein ACW5R3_04240 [Bizionia sp. KMM 8389]